MTFNQAAIRLLLAVAMSCAAQLASAETWRFALIGDTPYSDTERAELPKMLAAITEQQVAFIAHIGDFKSGATRCDDATFEDRLRLFDASRVPFIFVPGDNEWTDCDRINNGAYDPLERLGKLPSCFGSATFRSARKNCPRSASRVPIQNTPDSNSALCYLSH